jgi:uncharacterized protein (DUF58 family)
VVLPYVHPIHRAEPRRRGYAGDDAQGRRGRRGEFYGLRDFREGDDVRDVHWRSSARRGRTLVREHEDEAARRVTLFLDNALPGGAACRDPALCDGLERAVSLCASLAAHFLERGFAVRLVARGESVPFAVGVPQLDRLLRVLALLPTVDEEVALAGAAPRGGDSFYVARRGAAPPRDDYGAVLDA